MAPARCSQFTGMAGSKLLLLAFASLLSSGVLPGTHGLDLAAPHATFYGGQDVSGTNNGACGYGNTFTFGYGIMTTALSAVLFRDGVACGSCYKLYCTGSASCYPDPILVTATNLCPQGSFSGVCDWPQQHFDLSAPAFAAFADPNVGVVNVNYQKVPCTRTGGIKFNIQGHTYFFQVVVYNVAGAGDVTALSVAGSNTGWVALNRGWGDVWNTGYIFDGQPLSFAVTTSDGRTVTSWNCAGQYWQYGQTFEGAQF